LKDILKENHSGNFTKVVLFFYESAPPHWALVTQKKLAYLDLQCLDHPPYSPGVAPSDYHLFLGLKKIGISPFFVRRGIRSLPRGIGRTDSILNYFFEWLAKVRATG